MAPRAAKRRPVETDLYAPVRDFLTGLGYTVRAEVAHCDVTAVRGEELVVVELKLGFNVDLLCQATARQALTESVYVALPRPRDASSGLWKGTQRILKRLELGLLLVGLDSPSPGVEVAFHPMPPVRRKNAKARRALLAEIGRRSGDYNLGGSVRKQLMTAYRENAIFIASCLDVLGPSSPRRLRAVGTGERTRGILYDDVYGWFERIGRAEYVLTAKGRTALDSCGELAARYRARATPFVSS
jgi:hypothetical protein